MFLLIGKGFFFTLSLIVAIGPQNAYVLEKSVRKQHIRLIVSTCILCDIFFFFVGAFSIGAISKMSPTLYTAFMWGSAVFLFSYGGRSLLSSFKKNRLLPLGEGKATRYGTTLMVTLAVTLLNPHFYIDTIFLFGTIASKYQDQNRILFLTGACLGSIFWFISLGLVGGSLSRIFAKEMTWRILDVTIAVMMFGWSLSIALPLISW